MRTFFGVIVLALTPAVVTAVQEVEDVITLRVTPDVKVETLMVLADSAVADVAEVSEAVSVADFLRTAYGTAHQTLEAVFRHVNPSVAGAVIPAGTRVNLPPLPRWEFNVEVVIPQGLTVSEVALREVGAFGPKTKAAIAALNPRLRGNLDDVKADETVTFPHRLTLFTARLRPSADRAALLRALADDEAVLVDDVDMPFQLVDPVGFELASGEGCSVSENPAEKVADRDAESVRRLGSTPVVIAVVDSGLPPGDYQLPLWSNPEELVPDDGKDDDQNGFVDDVIGADITRSTTGFPADDIVNAWRGHGVHVLGIAAGAVLPDAVREAIQSRVRMAVVKVTSRDGSVTPAALVNGINYADRIVAAVVNISLEGGDDNDVKEAVRRTDKRIVYVTAAGNGRGGIGRDLDDENVHVFPAELSASLGNVISVAAHDQHGNPTCFSNFGDQSVDIAAPGVLVDSLVAHDRVDPRNGTSQATAFVSLASALLIAGGLSKPDVVRTRLILSADYTPLMEGWVKAAGRLNISKALAFRDDLIELHGGCAITGAIQPPFDVPLAGGATLSLRQIRKMSRIERTDGGPSHRIVIVRDGKLHAFPGTPLIEHIAIRTGGQLKHVPLADIIDFVRAVPGQPSGGSLCYPVHRLWRELNPPFVF